MLKLKLAALIAASMLWASGSGAQVVAPNTYTNYDFGFTGFFNLDTNMTWVTEPEGEAWRYAAMQFGFEGGAGCSGNCGGGYMGVTYSNGLKRVGFSIWDHPDTGFETVGLWGTCQRFSHEGNGTMCWSDFDWQEGHTYQYRVWQVGLDPNPSWGAWISDVDTGDSYFIGWIRTAPEYGNLKGKVSTWVEHFFTDTAFCEGQKHNQIVWSEMKANGGFSPISTTLNTGGACGAARVVPSFLHESGGAIGE